MGVDQNVIIALLVVLVVIIMIINTKPTEFLVSNAVGTRGYVHFYKDFTMDEMLFRIDGSHVDDIIPKYFKYDLKGDAKSMDINLPKEGPKGRKVEIWARYPYNNNSIDVTDFYNIYDRPEYIYGAHPNLKLIATVLPGQRFKSDDITPSNRFLVVVKV